ncbi:hypothetical protein BGO17_03940 [Candidatus Saccharibacteria bacterium 49-20]|nr:MAG: hypothetical protein BGO17_03940 [Candidatus Saccharibacteria bacterium 49-20]
MRENNNRGSTNMSVNANTIISDEMSLDEKLAAIDAMMASAVANAQQTSSNSVAAPLDPADLTMCLGCQ